MLQIRMLKAPVRPWVGALALTLMLALPVVGQENFTPNGVRDERVNAYALTGATIHAPDGEVREDAALLIRDGRIVEIVDGGDVVPGSGNAGSSATEAAATTDDGYFIIDVAGKHIYPGLIDIYTDYGISELTAPDDSNGGGENLLPDPRALNVNNAIRANFRASEGFVPDEDVREKFRELGFSAVLSLRPDGIARGTSALITLADESANESVIVADAAAHFSLDKGTSIQNMPSSLMGSFALLRQTYLDAEWFGAHEPRPFADETLEALLRHQSLPQIIEVDNWELVLTADKVGDEFGIQYVLKTSGDSYQRAELLKNTGATLIVPLAFPDAPDVADALDAERVSLAELKHWELAPFNTRILAEHDIPFAITSGVGSDSGSNGNGDFWQNLRKAVANGLPEEVALDALTRTPAQLLGAEQLVGQLLPDAYANFLITSGDLFDEDTVLLENWIKGQRHFLADDYDNRAGRYALTLSAQDAATPNSQNAATSTSQGSSIPTSTMHLTLETTAGQLSATITTTPLTGTTASDSANQPPDEQYKASIELTDDIISLSFAFDATGNKLRLNGWPTADGWRGNGRTSDGEPINWTLLRTDEANNTNQPASDSEQTAATTPPELPAAITYPFMAYGRTTPPPQQDMLIRGATVWTSEDAAPQVTDVLVRDGKIAAIGNNLNAGNAQVINGNNRHLTPGIIDEHAHIALFNINERETNSSMVRMKDVVNSENINIYRNLAGGVTAAQLLHGSANPIGGQSAIIKMRWGEAAPGLLIENADEFIKFALGENVKRSTNPASIRYPQTRMGVEQVFVNAFSQAQEYGNALEEYNNLSNSARRNTPPPRRDLAKEAILEVLNSERYVTSHSYVQSEINMLMHVADSFGFNINTFTHILEGYKVADKMARHGAGGSTFSDWWGYKWEVRYAIPYNAALMQQAGVVVAINSDDAEMSRRLNQEAAKAIKYGNMSEVDALKLVTLNPAILLHLDERMGSISVGKDADLVLWDDHPLSVYAVADTTWVDGIPYYDREEDAAMRQRIADERARIIATITNQESSGNGRAD